MHSSQYLLWGEYSTVPICRIQQLSANVDFKDCNPQNSMTFQEFSSTVPEFEGTQDP